MKRLFQHRDLYKTIIVPLYLQDFSGIINRFSAYIFCSAVVQFRKRVLVYIQNNCQPASFLKLFADQVGIVECNSFFFIRSQKISVCHVFSIAGPANVIGQMKIFAIGQYFVQRNTNVHIFFINAEFDLSNKRTIDQ